jgi:hypothetical protein
MSEFEGKKTGRKSSPKGARIALLGGAPAGLEILEEVGIRIQYQHVAFTLEARLVRIQTAVEGIELRALLIGRGDLRQGL